MIDEFKTAREDSNRTGSHQTVELRFWIIIPMLARLMKYRQFLAKQMGKATPEARGQWSQRLLVSGMRQERALPLDEFAQVMEQKEARCDRKV